MRFSRRPWLDGACLAVALMFPEKAAMAQQSQNWTWCENKNHAFSADLAINGCTTVIQSGGDQKKRARAFINRGVAYQAKADHDSAIADYNQAIRIDPKSAFHNRGLVFFYNGDFEKAVADLLLANDLKDDAYAMLWRYLARGHMGQDGAAELSVNATRLKTTNWPYAVIDFYLGRRSLDEMRASAGNTNEQCEFAWQLLRGNKAEARASLQVAVDTCPKTFVEYPGAISELRRLGQ